MPHAHHKHKSSHPHKKMPLISIQMASKTYGDDPLDFKNLVLRNIYLEIFEGEFVTIFGPSGSGKSTLLNLIAGLEKPTGGRVLVRRRDLSNFNTDELAQFHRRKMGFVFQNFNLIKSLNVWENVALPQTASGVNYSERKRKAIRLLKLLHLDHYANRHPNELSGGEQQRVAIARALINDPYFLLVDEPTGNLDSTSADEVMNILKDIHTKDKHTIILVTHNPAQLKYSSRVIYMEDGQVVIEENRDAKGEVSSRAEIVRGTTTTTKRPIKTDTAPDVVAPSETPTPVAAPAPAAAVNPPAEAPESPTPATSPAAPPVASAPTTAAAPTPAPPASQPAEEEFVNDDTIKTVIIKGEGDE